MSKIDFFGDIDAQQIMADLSEPLSKIKPLEFIELISEEFYKILEDGPAKEYLPVAKGTDCEDELPRNDNGNYYYIKEDNKVEIPEEFNSLVELSFKAWINYECTQDKDKREVIWHYLDRVVSWIMDSKKDLSSQLSSILKNPKIIYQNYKARVIHLVKECEDDKFDFILLIPDMFVCLCRMLADTSLPAEFRIKVSLALVYLISPLDILPEYIITHPIALTDDFLVILYVMSEGIDKKYTQKEKFEGCWIGQDSFYEEIGSLIEKLEVITGKNIFEKVALFFEHWKGEAAD